MLNNNPDENGDLREDWDDDGDDEECDGVYDDDDYAIEHDPDPCTNLDATLRLSRRCPWMY